MQKVQYRGLEDAWEDVRVALFSRTGGTAPSYTSGFAGNASLYTWHFSPSAANMLYFETQLPHGWDGGVIYPHVHWSPTTTGTGVVRWVFEYVLKSINETFGASSNLICDSEIATASQWKHVIAGNVSGVTPGATQDNISAIMVGRLYRDGAATEDTYADAAALLAIDIHYKTRYLGSRTVSAR